MLGDRGTKLSKNFHSNIDPVFKLFFGVYIPKKKEFKNKNKNRV